MKMLLCLHGNPLNGQEFESLLPELQKNGYHPIIHKRPIRGSQLEPLLQSINATAKVSGGGPFGLLAYSWGAYLALAYLQRFPENLTGVLLINPLLVDKNSRGLGSKLVFGTPLLRTVVLKFLRRKMAANYISKIFYPKEPSQEVKNELQTYLANSSVWRGAAAYKKLMIEKPLSKESSVFQIPLKVLFGEKDEFAPKKEQLQVLQNLNDPSFKTIPLAGHALPWSHQSLILDEINQMFPL
jgi:pimeloyl-ACP methyl ester carboxylesterase